MKKIKRPSSGLQFSCASCWQGVTGENESSMEVTSSINILGGYENLSNLPAILAEHNISGNERTLASKARYGRAINKVFFNFNKKDLHYLFMATMSSKSLSEEVKLRVMALQFYSNDILFRLLFTDCFLPIFLSGRINMDKHDIIAFMNDKSRKDELNLSWSRETIDTVSRKYLSVLKKLNFLEGKVKKTINEPNNNIDFLIIFHFWLASANESSNIFQSSYFPFLMVSKEKYQFLMKQPQIREKFNWYYTGEKFSIEPKIPLNEYIDELRS